MKRFISIVIVIGLLVILGDYVWFHTDWFRGVPFQRTVTTFTKTESDKIYLDRGSGFEPFEIRGVNMGSAMPGEWSTDFAITKDMYLRWFEQIKAMGANTVRLYTINSQQFYEAFYEYNNNNPDPLYLLQGVWVNDYVQNSHMDAYDKAFYDTFVKDCHTMVDVIHGNRKLNMGDATSAPSGVFTRDVSQWVIGYILGVEWYDLTVAYTNERYENNPAYCGYEGAYMCATEEASPFETMLARVGDSAIRYETEKYGTQRLIAFSNWPNTDPFEYPTSLIERMRKVGVVDVEHIKTTEHVLSGQFASYHVYPYYPDYLHFVDDWSFVGMPDKTPFYNEDGALNTYRAYLQALNLHHTMPVVISEFGVSSGRGIARLDINTGRNQGHMSEQEQGKALEECYADIMETGSAGSCVFTWQDEWSKRSWNTRYAVTMKRNVFWSDYQTNEQHYGMLAFDPGKEQCICYVDGDVSEWTEQDVVAENGDMTLSMKYDERYVYFRVHKPGLDLEKDTIYIPIDTTQKSGATQCLGTGLSFDRAADFLITIDGKENSKIQVQEYYESLRANFAEEIYGYNTYYKENIPQADSPLFVDILLALSSTAKVIEEDTLGETFPTGSLLYGNANPESPDFNSLSDFMASGDDIELKIPWQLLNFFDPSTMQIHDDYYSGNYGVAAIKLDCIYAGVGTDGQISMASIPMKGWKNNVTYHERLKPAYFVMQKLWAGENTPG